MNKFFAEIVIIGGGPAGLSAALAITGSRDRSVLIVDDNPLLGGQIWRSELGRIKSPETLKLIEKIGQNRIRIINNASVYAALDKTTMLAETSSGPIKLEFEKLILATGARERFLPFPGWTLPNVFGAAGLQALVKSGLPVKDKRIVVAGTGPLLLAAADYLRSKGGRILLIAEQTSRAKLLKFGIGLVGQPNKILQATGLRAKLFGTKSLTDCFVASASGKDKLEAVNLIRHGRKWRVACDFLATGFHLVPNTEPAAVLGCRLENGFVGVNDWQETSERNIFCAGEPTGIGGVELSLIEGEIAGLAAIGEKRRAAGLFRKRASLRRFADSLNKTFELRSELKETVDDATIVCRCEDVAFGRLKKYSGWREAKLQTRCGMGACQGRICGAAVEYLLDWKNNSVRPPLFPVRLESLAEAASDNKCEQK